MAGANDQATRRRRREALGDYARRDYAPLHLHRFVLDLGAWLDRVAANGLRADRLPPSLASRLHLLIRPSAQVERQFGRAVLNGVSVGDALSFLLAPFDTHVGLAWGSGAAPPAAEFDGGRLRGALLDALSDPEESAERVEAHT